MVAKEGAHAIALAGTHTHAHTACHRNHNTRTPVSLLLFFRAGDVSTEEFATDAVDKTLNAFGRIDILVNNAGCQALCDRIADISAKQLVNTFAVNVFSACASLRCVHAAECDMQTCGCMRLSVCACVRNCVDASLFQQTVYLSKAVLPHMKHGGAIINTTSVAAYKGRADMIDCACPQHTTQMRCVLRESNGCSADPHACVCAWRARRHGQQGRTVRTPLTHPHTQTHTARNAPQ
jgi:NAD(P)-dependent dehydrogenase (short-subunit alcohol dehydrogenase family)